MFNNHLPFNQLRPSDYLRAYYLRANYLRAYKAPPRQLSRVLYKSACFMQNKPNFRKSQMNVNDDTTKDYGKRTLGKRGKNKANSKPIKANLPDAQMSASSFSTKDYENKPLSAVQENKPNQTQFQTQKNADVFVSWGPENKTVAAPACTLLLF